MAGICLLQRIPVLIERIAGELGIEARPRFEGLGGATPGIIVIVTQDMQGL